MDKNEYLTCFRCCCKCDMKFLFTLFVCQTAVSSKDRHKISKIRLKKIYMINILGNILNIRTCK